MKLTRPYGSWPSPISAEAVSQQAINPVELSLDDQQLYWLQACPAEGGRNTVMQLDHHGQAHSVLPAPYNCRSRVHEYGGGAYAVYQNTLYFCEFRDHQLYSMTIGQPDSLRQLSNQPLCRFGAISIDPHRGKLLAVAEQHGEGEPVNSLVSIAITGDQPLQTLHCGEDFYAGAQLSRTGNQLSWVSWSHPAMPWQSSRLWLADITEDGSLSNPRPVAGGEQESICQPRWSATGELYFISDRSGWWNLYRWRDGSVQALFPKPADFAVPQWVFGQSNYALLADGRLIASYCQQGYWQLMTLDCNTGDYHQLNGDYVHLSQVQSDGQAGYFIGVSGHAPAEIVRLQPGSGQCSTLHTPPNNHPLQRAAVSQPFAISFSSDDGHPVHGLYYLPHNPLCEAPDGDKPPLLVIAHGGPTGAASPAFDPAVQFWTSRGFAVLAVNYRGSAHYGRDYRRALEGNWGLADARDCIAGARYLADKALVDASRLLIRGNSAGGFTVLSAMSLATVFAAGASYYGISDLELLAQQTHKFESHYMDSLIGRYPEQRRHYQQRSAIHHVDKLQRPMIFLQGLQDRVVPANQTRQMVAALRQNRVPVTEILFEDEGHGFRKADNIVTALTCELHFYGRILGIEIVDPISPALLDLLPPANQPPAQ